MTMLPNSIRMIGYVLRRYAITFRFVNLRDFQTTPTEFICDVFRTHTGYAHFEYIPDNICSGFINSPDEFVIFRGFEAVRGNRIGVFPV